MFNDLGRGMKLGTGMVYGMLITSKGTWAVGHSYDLFWGHFRPLIDKNRFYLDFAKEKKIIYLRGASKHLQHTFPYGYKYR